MEEKRTARTTVAQFRPRQIYLPAALRSGFAEVKGTSLQTSTMYAHLTSNTQAQYNVLFALTAAAFDPDTVRPDLYLSQTIHDGDSLPSPEVSGVQIPGELPSPPPQFSPSTETASDMQSEGRADSAYGALVKQIVISPPSAPNNVLVTFEGDKNQYMLSGEVTALMQILLFAKMRGMAVDKTATGYVVDGHGYVDEIYADPYDQRGGS